MLDAAGPAEDTIVPIMINYNIIIIFINERETVPGAVGQEGTVSDTQEGALGRGNE